MATASLPRLFSDDVARTALAAARAAAAVHREHLGRLSAEAAVDKGRADFVTAVDLEAQRAALAVIRARHPDDEILAEEEDGEMRAGDARHRAEGPGEGCVWIVDPLDGTTNFLHGHPSFCASVGVVSQGVPLAGAVVATALGLSFLGRRGEGAWMWRHGEIPGALGDPVPTSPLEGADDGNDPHDDGPESPPLRIRTSNATRLDRALVATGFPFKRPAEIPDYLEELGRILAATGGVRRDGAAALDLCLLARGTFDAFWEGFLSPWDVAGGLAILAEAGGSWSGPGGAPFDLLRGGPLRAANGRALLEALHPLLEGGGGKEAK